MAKEEHQRALILSSFHAGLTAKQIVDHFIIKKATVYALKKKLDAFVAEGNKPEDFSAKRKQHKKRSDAMDRAFIMDVERLIQEDPSRSMRAIARELNVSATVVRRVVKKEIKLKSYALKRGQFMNQGTKERRLAKAKKKLL